MRLLRLRFLIALIAPAALAAYALGAPLPFELISSDLPWRVVESQKAMNIGSTLEALILSTSYEARFVVVSCVDDPTDGETLSSYARKIKTSVKPSQKIAAVEKTEEKFGFTGTDLKFEIDNDQQAMACELFTFVHANRRWGLLFLINREDAAKIPDPFAIFRATAAPPVGVLGMTPFKVKDNAVTGFPISFTVKSDLASGHVEHLTVTEVPSRSSTEYAGVREGDEILAINGKKASEYTIGLGKNSELGQIFLNRHPGDEVTLEVITPGNKKSQTVVLRIPNVSSMSTIWDHR